MKIALLIIEAALRADVTRALEGAGHTIEERGDVVVTDEAKRAEKRRPVDALPGMFTPRGFLDALAWSRALARATTSLEGRDRVRALARAHAAPPTYTPREERGASARPTSRGGNAREAGQLAATKMMVERPLLDQIDDIATTVRRDESFNQTVLHPMVHAQFARGLVDDDEASLTEWLYGEVFQMPSSDPWLGLVQGYAALDDDGRSAA